MDEPDFLAAIAADPDDDGAWHVYADWLEEQADPRAELLRLHLERAGGPSVERRDALNARIDELEAQYWEPCQVFAGRRRHGLMTSIGMTGADFIHDADHVFSRNPVRGLTLKKIGAPRMAERIAESPWLERLRMLGFVGDERAREVATVLRSEHLHGLEHVVVRTKRFGKTILAALCEMTWVRKLSLIDCDLDDSLLGQLAEQGRFDELEELDLRGNWRVSDSGVDALADFVDRSATLRVRWLPRRRSPMKLASLLDSDNHDLPGTHEYRTGFGLWY